MLMLELVVLYYIRLPAIQEIRVSFHQLHKVLSFLFIKFSFFKRKKEALDTGADLPDTTNGSKKKKKKKKTWRENSNFPKSHKASKKIKRERERRMEYIYIYIYFKKKNNKRKGTRCCCQLFLFSFKNKERKKKLWTAALIMGVSPYPKIYKNKRPLLFLFSSSVSGALLPS
jgi:hypothetical protein